MRPIRTFRYHLASLLHSCPRGDGTVFDDMTMRSVDYHLQDNLDIPMEDPQRGELGKKAYWDFVRALRHIQNLEVDL